MRQAKEARALYEEFDRLISQEYSTGEPNERLEILGGYPTLSSTRRFSETPDSETTLSVIRSRGIGGRMNGIHSLKVDTLSKSGEYNSISMAISKGFFGAIARMFGTDILVLSITSHDGENFQTKRNAVALGDARSMLERITPRRQ